MSATIKHFNVIARKPSYPEATLCVVLHADHLASHAYDEEKERALFEYWFTETYTAHKLSPKLTNCGIIMDGYADSRVDLCWRGWIACAKSRAKAAGYE